MRGSIKDVFIGLGAGGWTGRTKLQFKIVVARVLVKSKNQPGGVVLATKRSSNTGYTV